MKAKKEYVYKKKPKNMHTFNSRYNYKEFSIVRGASDGKDFKIKKNGNMLMLRYPHEKYDCWTLWNK